jgi:Cof subfamily protein (haloacid dehalogenase superfamily)
MSKSILKSDNLLENALIVSEYESLRQEIQARIGRISHLQEGLLLGTLIYITTFYTPKLAEAQTQSPATLLFYIFLLILPFVAFVVELLCISEQDAVFRAGIYIRDNIERNFRWSTFRGWEDWLDRLDKVKRRRTSDNLFRLTRRYLIIPLYCIASSLIGGIGLLHYFSTVMNFTNNFYYSAICVVTLFLIYIVSFSIMVSKLDRAGKEEFSNPYYNLLVLDVDGCLLDDNKEISKENIKALTFLKRKGVRIILASGRGATSLGRICKLIGIEGNHVACHGASIYNATNNQESQLDEILNQNDLDIIIPKINERNIMWVAYGVQKYYCNQSNKEQIKDRLIGRTDINTEDDIIEGIQEVHSYNWPEQINKILCFIQADDHMNESFLSESLSRQFNVMRSTNETFEIVNKETSKVTALGKAVGITELKKLKSLVVGDYDNDIELLKWGQLSIAPSNASPKVHGIKEITKLDFSNNEDFIKEVIRIYYKFVDE